MGHLVPFGGAFGGAFGGPFGGPFGLLALGFGPPVVFFWPTSPKISEVFCLW